MKRHIAFMLCVACGAWPLTAVANAEREWRFAVSLDGKPIGYHRFELDVANGNRRLLSEARFNVKLWFFNAYTYRHDAREVWRGNCLQSLQARTDDNGVRTVVNGTRDNNGFVVTEAGARNELTSCVQTFAYWNPDILSATHLLNPQTGEYVPVKITHVDSEILTVQQHPVKADRYRIVGKSKDGTTMQIDVWYSPDRRWLALESLTDGRRLHYRIQ